jgi:hypothetical protein
MRFEELSTPVESRILATAILAAEKLRDDVHTLLGMFNATRDDVNSAVRLLDSRNVSAAVARAMSPGGLASVLLIAAIIVRALQYTVIRTRATRLVGAVTMLANAERNERANHSKAE